MKLQKAVLFAFGVGITLLLSGCGQTGPLYLPPPKQIAKEHQKSPAVKQSTPQNVDKTAPKYA